MPYRQHQLNSVKAWAVTPASAWFSKTPLVAAVLLGSLLGAAPVLSAAQAPAAVTAPAGGAQRGTVKAISGSTLTLTTDAGKEITANVADSAKVLQIAPGSTDLKTAQTIALTDIAVGDRVLVTGKAGEGDSLAASRVILMKSGDIAQKHAAEQADWTKRGSGGIVSAVDASGGTITVTSGAKRTQVATTGTTIFRRYAGDSVKFEDAQPGTMAQIQPGDQVRVRGAKSEDGSSIQAEEIVSGSFRNLSGTVVSVDATAGAVTLNDLATKKKVVVKVTANSDIRNLPPQAAAMFAARGRGGAGAAGGAGAQGAGGAGRPAGPPAGDAAAGSGDGAGRGPGGGQGQGRGAGGGRGSMDLAQMISRLPTGSLATIKTGDALMIVASQGQAGAITAITMLSGVEPILAASPTGAAPAITLSPFGFGGGAPEMGGGGPQ